MEEGKMGELNHSRPKGLVGFRSIQVRASLSLALRGRLRQNWLDHLARSISEP